MIIVEHFRANLVESENDNQKSNNTNYNYKNKRNKSALNKNHNNHKNHKNSNKTITNDALHQKKSSCLDNNKKLNSKDSIKNNNYNIYNTELDTISELNYNLNKLYKIQIPIEKVSNKTKYSNNSYFTDRANNLNSIVNSNSNKNIITSVTNKNVTKQENITNLNSNINNNITNNHQTSNEQRNSFTEITPNNKNKSNKNDNDDKNTYYKVKINYYKEKYFNHREIQEIKRDLEQITQPKIRVLSSHNKRTDYCGCINKPYSSFINNNGVSEYFYYQGNLTLKHHYDNDYDYVANNNISNMDVVSFNNRLRKSKKRPMSHISTIRSSSDNKDNCLGTSKKFVDSKEYLILKEKYLKEKNKQKERLSNYLKQNNNEYLVSNSTVNTNGNSNCNVIVNNQFSNELLNLNIINERELRNNDHNTHHSNNSHEKRIINNELLCLSRDNNKNELKEVVNSDLNANENIKDINEVVVKEHISIKENNFVNNSNYTNNSYNKVNKFHIIYNNKQSQRSINSIKSSRNEINPNSNNSINNNNNDSNISIKDRKEISSKLLHLKSNSNNNNNNISNISNISNSASNIRLLNLKQNITNHTISINNSSKNNVYINNINYEISNNLKLTSNSLSLHNNNSSNSNNKFNTNSLTKLPNNINNMNLSVKETNMFFSSLDKKYNKEKEKYSKNNNKKQKHLSDLIFLPNSFKREGKKSSFNNSKNNNFYNKSKKGDKRDKEEKIVNSKNKNDDCSNNKDYNSIGTILSENYNAIKYSINNFNNDKHIKNSKNKNLSNNVRNNYTLNRKNSKAIYYYNKYLLNSKTKTEEELVVNPKTYNNDINNNDNNGNYSIINSNTHLSKSPNKRKSLTEHIYNRLPPEEDFLKQISEKNKKSKLLASQANWTRHMLGESTYHLSNISNFSSQYCSNNNPKNININNLNKDIDNKHSKSILNKKSIKNSLNNIPYERTVYYSKPVFEGIEDNEFSELLEIVEDHNKKVNVRNNIEGKNVYSSYKNALENEYLDYYNKKNNISNTKTDLSKNISNKNIHNEDVFSDMKINVAFNKIKSQKSLEVQESYYLLDYFDSLKNMNKAQFKELINNKLFNEETLSRMKFKEKLKLEDIEKMLEQNVIRPKSSIKEKTSNTRYYTHLSNTNASKIQVHTGILKNNDSNYPVIKDLTQKLNFNSINNSNYIANDSKSTGINTNTKTKYSVQDFKTNLIKNRSIYSSVLKNKRNKVSEKFVSMKEEYFMNLPHHNIKKEDMIITKSLYLLPNGKVKLLNAFDRKFASKIE